MSSDRLGIAAGTASPDATIPIGRCTGVPDTTTEPARPWYATGMRRQFGINGSLSGRRICPRFVAWWIDEYEST